MPGTSRTSMSNFLVLPIFGITRCVPREYYLSSLVCMLSPSDLQKFYMGDGSHMIDSTGEFFV